MNLAPGTRVVLVAPEPEAPFSNRELGGTLATVIDDSPVGCLVHCDRPGFDDVLWVWSVTVVPGPRMSMEAAETWLDS